MVASVGDDWVPTNVLTAIEYVLLLFFKGVKSNETPLAKVFLGFLLGMEWKEYGALHWAQDGRRWCVEKLDLWLLVLVIVVVGRLMLATIVRWNSVVGPSKTGSPSGSRRRSGRGWID